MTSDEAASDLPDLGGRYVIDATIGTGGMASVARAHDRTTGERVAVKRLHDHLADDPHFEKILLDEARLQTLVRHPNVVATLDVGRMSGRLTLVLELVEGSSLSRVLRIRGALEPSMVVEVGCQMLAGLAAAHGARDEHGAALDLVHRDVSPQNALLDREGAVKLADFGVARARSRLQTTTEGRIKGKLAYMSPEQIEGHPIDARSDLFSTGAVLWELLTGTRLFRGESEGELVRKILSQPIPKPSSEREGVSAAIDEVIVKSLARDPAERWQTAAEMSRALEAAHPRAGREALSAIAPEPPSAVHSVTTGASAFAPTVEAAPPVLEDDREGTEIVSRSSLRRSSPRAAFVALGVVVVAGGATAAYLFASRPSEKPATTATVASEATPPPPSLSAAPPASIAGTESAAPSAAPSATPPRPTVRVVRPAPSSTTAASSSALRPSCDPPYRVDERGVRVFRTECL